MTERRNGATLEQLDTAVDATTEAKVLYLARALNSQSLDEFVTRVTDSTGTQIDPLTQAPLESVSNDELRSRLYAPDTGGTLQQATMEALDTAIAAGDFGLVTYMAGALASIADDEVRVNLHTNNAGTLPVEQQTPVGVENEAGEQVDPDSADAAYANGATLSGNGEVTRTLVARGGDDVVGRVVSTGQYDVEVRYQDDAGNTIFTETVASNVAGGTVTQLGPNDTTVDPASDHVVIAVLDDTGNQQTVDAVLHYN